MIVLGGCQPMWGLVPPEAAQPARVSVDQAALDGLRMLVKALPCTTIKCAGASPGWTSLCPRCQAVEAFSRLNRQPV